MTYSSDFLLKLTQLAFAAAIREDAAKGIKPMNNQKNSPLLSLAAIAAALGLLLASTSAQAQTTLEQGFDNPPANVRPGTWFHVMSGNMTKEGITLDLEAMARVGIGHVTMFHVTQGIPLGRVKFASDEHIALVAHAAAESKRLGMTFGIHNADGWTSSGGPWVTPEQSMKRVVWSEAVVKGGRVSTKLRAPPNMAGYYQDIATIAFPAQAGDAADQALTMAISATGKGFNADLVTDQLYDASTKVDMEGKEAALTIDLGKPRAIAHADMMVEDGRDHAYQVSASDDGRNWRTLGKMLNSRSGKSEATVTGNWDQATARYFRITAPADFTVKEVRLLASQRIPDFYALSSLSNYKNRTSSTPEPSDADPFANADTLAVIDPAKIIDLSKSLKPDGTLSAKLPKGEWTILRLGYTSTGAVNVPASPEGTGLEVDKFSKAAIESHYNAYMRKVVDAARAIRPDAFDRTIIDSYEVGGQNWTQDYETIFRRAMGKDILPYLPLYTGRMVGGAEESRAFLTSIRDLNNTLMVDNYFGHFTKLAHQDKLKVYIEAYGFGPFSDIDAAQHADIPMGEFWLGRPNEQMSAMISAGHIYGRKEIAAEAFTAMDNLNWSFHPGMAKTRGDDAWTKGINAFVFHRFAHQANTYVKPGMTMNRWGAHFDRHQPWWNSAGKAWFSYMARGQFLLQQGYAVADIAYFVGDEAPSTCLGFDKQEKWLPKGYKADCINNDVLLNRATLSKNRIMLPEGNGYAALVLGNNRHISDQTISGIEILADRGIPVFGDKPAPMVPLGAPAGETERLQARIDSLWAKPSIKPVSELANILPSIQQPRFLTGGGASLPFAQRRSEEGDVYFTFNPADKAQGYELSLAGSGYVPEIWDAVTGTRGEIEQYSYDNGRTQFLLPLEAGQSAFVILRKKAEANPQSPNRLPAASQTIAAPVNWSIRLAEVTGGNFTLPAGPLVDLRDHPDTRAQDFAGVATYKSILKLAANQMKGAKRIWLDLGQVSVSATVRVNGKEIAASWMPPHRIDIASALEAGENSIEIDVATLWSNRLIADAALPDVSGFVLADRSNKPTTPMVQWYMDNVPPPTGPRKTFATQNFFKPTDPRVSAGLIGPIKITLEK